MNRRDLIQKVVQGGTVLILVPSVLQSCTKSTNNDPGGNVPGSEIKLDLTLAENAALNTTGGSRIVQNILVISLGGGAYVALSSICTHQGCTVGYDSGAGNIKCPCHGSVYTTTGSVINGPAPLPLQSYVINKAGNILTISL